MNEVPGMYAEYNTKQAIPRDPYVATLYVYRPPLQSYSFGRFAGPDGMYQRDIGPYKAPLRSTGLPRQTLRQQQAAYVKQSQSGNKTTQYVALKAPRVPTTLQPRNIRQRG